MDHLEQTDSVVVVEWGFPSEAVAVGSVQELDGVLDRIQLDSDPTLPFVATIVRGVATMSISQGPDWSIVSFAFVSGEEPFHISLGDRKARGVVNVLFGGEDTEQDKWSCIDSVLAREVVRHFYRTGGLSPVISWAPSALWDQI